MAIVNFREFRKNLSNYLRLARQGEEVSVVSRGVEMARLVPPHSHERPKRVPGGMAGQIWIAPDFDETPAEIIALMTGEAE